MTYQAKTRRPRAARVAVLGVLAAATLGVGYWHVTTAGHPSPAPAAPATATVGAPAAPPAAVVNSPDPAPAPAPAPVTHPVTHAVTAPVTAPVTPPVTRHAAPPTPHSAPPAASRPAQYSPDAPPVADTMVGGDESQGGPTGLHEGMTDPATPPCAPGEAWTGTQCVTGP